MRPRVSARLVAAGTMLELSGLALQDAITRELDENPALEADEVSTCEVCGTPLQGSICPTCLRLQRVDLPSDGSMDGRDDDFSMLSGRQDGDDDFDPLVTVAGRSEERRVGEGCGERMG